jgi:hypothetical protein
VSLHYELVIAVHLRGDLADSDLAEVRWHLGIGTKPDEALIRDGPLFGPEGASYLPGGDITRLDQEVRAGSGGPASAWGVFVRRFMLDDTLYELLTPLCGWLAAVATDGYAGFWREEDEMALNVMIVRQGHTYMATSSADVEPATFAAPPWADP